VHVGYTMAISGVVDVKVYSVAGTLVQVVHDAKPAGGQTSVVDVSRLASGVYFYRLNLRYDDGDAEDQLPRKFMVLR
jgi:hypothetical protein